MHCNREDTPIVFQYGSDYILEIEWGDMDGDEIHGYDPDMLAFFNINTPEELMEAEELVQEDK